MVGVRGSQQSADEVSAALINPGGPPSGCINWQLSLEFASRSVHAEISLPPLNNRTLTLAGRKETLTLKADEFWTLKASQPIPAGGVSLGWIWGLFRAVSEDDIYHQRPTLVLSCDDVVTGNHHALRTKLGMGHPGITIPGQ